jgi:hypothetical protein
MPLKGRIVLSAVFWGFAGVCDTSSLKVGLSGDVPPDLSSAVINSTQFACKVTWDTGENFTVGVDMQVTLALSGGHAAFVGYSVVVTPHYLAGVPARSPDVVFANYANGTLMPSIEGGVFKGDAPTAVAVEMTWALFNDSTIRAPIPQQTGWLLNVGNVRRGDQANSSTFDDATNVVSVQFDIMRSSTYTRVLVQQTGTFLVVLGSIFAYTFTISNGLAAGGKGLEWAMRSCCKKQRSRTNAFFMAPYEGPQLEEMVGFKGYNTDADVKLTIMQRAEKTPSEVAGVAEPP